MKYPQKFNIYQPENIKIHSLFPHKSFTEFAENDRKGNVNNPNNEKNTGFLSVVEVTLERVVLMPSVFLKLWLQPCICATPIGIKGPVTPSQAHTYCYMF